MTHARAIISALGIAAALCTAAFALTEEAGSPVAAADQCWGSVTVAVMGLDDEAKLVFGSRDDKVYVVNADGTPVEGWPVATGGDVDGTPAVGDVDGDGNADVVVGSWDGKVYAWSDTGEALMGWPAATGGGINGSPALADLDGDGAMEVVIGSTDGQLYVIDGDGTSMPGWPVPVSGQIQSAPSVADIDADGMYEIVVGTTGGRLHALEVDGVAVAGGWPVVLDGECLSSGPAVGDLDADMANEIVVGTAAGTLYAFEGDGAQAWTTNLAAGAVYGSPALGDFDCDGDMDVVVGCYDQRLYALESDGTVWAGWPRVTTGQLMRGAVLSDVDGDGCPEVVYCTWYGSLNAIKADGGPVAGWPVSIGGNAVACPTLADGDQDGDLEVYATSISGELRFYDCGADSYAPDAMHWAHWRHDPRCSGAFTQTGGQLPPGWSLISLPLSPAVPAADVVFRTLTDAGNDLTENLHRFTSRLGFQTYPNDFSDLETGRGYWLMLEQGGHVRLSGTASVVERRIPIKGGWNLIGHPLGESIRLSDVRVTDGRSEWTWMQAVDAHLVQETLFYFEGVYMRCNPTGAGDSDVLRPGLGYWLLCLDKTMELSLVIME